MSTRKGSYDDFFLKPSSKKDRLRELQRDACYDLLHAFRAESFDLSQERYGIISDLIKKWNISSETLNVFEGRLKYEPLVVYSRKEREDQRLAAIFKKSNSEGPYVRSWGDLDPESLIGRWINIKLPDEDEYTAYHIRDYGDREEMHHLIAAYSPADYEDPCDWVDIRQFTAEEAIWSEENPGLTIKKRVRKARFPKPERTLLQTTLLREAYKADEEADDEDNDDEAAYGG